MKNAIKFIIVIILSLLVLTLFMPFSFTSNKVNDCYDVVMNDIDNDKKILDVAMLGAHDAFSGNIGSMSRPNVNEDSIVNNGFVNKIAKGLVVRLSKAQKANAKELLYSGVRYFDARVTLINGEFYTFHGYLSDSLDSYLIDIIDFLESHPTEFIILDIQEYYTSNGSDYNLSYDDWTLLINHLYGLKNSNKKTLFDFVKYDSRYDKISDLTVGKVTNNKTEGGLIILAKCSDFEKFYVRDTNANKDVERNYSTIRSYWNNINSQKEMLEAIENEYQFVKENGFDDVLVVNQAQMTGFISSAKIVRSLFKWSVIDMAKNFNKELVSDEERFNKWLDEMPIFMVDYTTSNIGDFNNKANQYIMKYNKK